MKWIIAAAVTLAALSQASPISDQSPNLVSRALTSTAEVANFDDLNPGSLNFNYKGLNFSNLAVIEAPTCHHHGIIPNTKPNYAINGPNANPYPYPPFISIDGTNTTYFDLTEFYFGCYDATTGAATTCQFTVAAYNALDSRHQGPYLMTFNPSGHKSAPMMQISPRFVSVRAAYTNIYMSNATVANTVSVLDSVQYVIYEG